MVLFGGNGVDFIGLSRGQIYEEGLNDFAGDPPAGGQRLACLSLLILDDADPYDLGNSVAAAILNANGKSVVGGYLAKSLARKFRKEVAALGLPQDETLMCKAVCFGGQPFGRYTLPYRLALDTSWPLTPVSNWHEVASPFFAEPLHRIA